MAGFFWNLSDFHKTEIKQSLNYIASSSGEIYKVKESKIGKVTIKANTIPALETLSEEFEFYLPKIPSQMLKTALSFFRAYWSSETQNEVMLRIVFDTVEQNYLFDCPEQYVSKVSIHAPFLGMDYQEPRYYDVLDIHSHHLMEARFSSKDDRNERKYKLYVVVGRMLNAIPDITVRVGYSGSFLYLPLQYIFDSEDASYPINQYPKEWDKRVKIMK